jgi:glycosyltransferase involved in cell wall biosynthesis
MRIGVIVPGFSADQSDWCIPALRHLTRELATTDEVRVIAIRYPHRARRYRIGQTEVVALGGGDRRGLSAALVWRKTLEAIQAEHRARRFDVMHAFWATESGLLAALAGRMLGIPTLVSLAGGELVSLPDIGYGDQRSRWERLKVRMSLRLASLVTAGSRSLVDLATRFVPRPKLRRAPLGVPSDLFYSSDGPGNGLLHVGTLIPVKDQATLLRAFALARHVDRSLCLTIVGGGPLRAALGDLAHSFGVHDAVRFCGDVDHAQLADCYRAARAFVLSSRHEAQGMVALEAAACGLSVAGTRVGVIPELSPYSATAEIGNPEALAQAMLAALANPCAPDVTEFTVEACTDRFRDLYAHLSGGR